LVAVKVKQRDMMKSKCSAEITVRRFYGQKGDVAMDMMEVIRSLTESKMLGCRD